jgi:hypothetical protein
MGIESISASAGLSSKASVKGVEKSASGISRAEEDKRRAEDVRRDEEARASAQEQGLGRRVDASA